MSVHAIVQSALKGLEPDIHACAAEVQVADNLPWVEADTFLLKMALTNLVGDALKFVPPGTRPCVAIGATQGNDLVRIDVRGRGIGIPPGDRAGIFEPFIRLYGEEDYPGAGLGLPTVRKAVELMGGRIRVEFTPGSGSTFSIELPRVEDGPEER